MDELDAVHGLDLLPGRERRGQDEFGQYQNGLCSHAIFSLSL
jgi:hypothetical protein